MEDKAGLVGLLDRYRLRTYIVPCLVIAFVVSAIAIGAYIAVLSVLGLVVMNAINAIVSGT